MCKISKQSIIQEIKSDPRIVSMEYTKLLKYLQLKYKCSVYLSKIIANSIKA